MSQFSQSSIMAYIWVQAHCSYFSIFSPLFLFSLFSMFILEICVTVFSARHSTFGILINNELLFI